MKSTDNWFKACFAGGNLLLGGAFLDMPDIYSLGLAVADSCHAFYNTTKTGLGPLGTSQMSIFR